MDSYKLISKRDNALICKGMRSNFYVDFFCRFRLKGGQMNKNMILAGLAGGIVGVITALLFAPKSGSQLMKTMYKPFAPLIRQALPQMNKSYKRVKAAAPSPLEVRRPRTKGTKSHTVAKNTTARRSPARKKSNHSTAETKNHSES